MGKVLSLLQRKANRFNVENRAQRVISRDKPIPAPRHPATIKALENLKDDSTFLEEQYKKDSHLDNRLKQVYVLSHDPMVVDEPTPSDSSRPLPRDRVAVEDPEFGFLEPAMIPKGRYTLRQAVKFISDYQTDPKTWSAVAIGKEYSLDVDKLEKILFYFRTFSVHIPDETIKEMQKKLKPNSKEAISLQKLLEAKDEKLQQEEQK